MEVHTFFSNIDPIKNEKFNDPKIVSSSKYYWNVFKISLSYFKTIFVIIQAREPRFMEYTSKVVVLAGNSPSDFLVGELWMHLTADDLN